MKLTLLSLAIGMFGLILVGNDAEAKRFGGGKSFGRSSPLFQRSAPAKSAQAGRPATNTPGTSNSRRWLGPIAGLVAGGLIGAMLFGDGFEGFQLMDFLLIAGLIFGAIWFFKRLANSKLNAQRTATAGGPAANPGMSGSGFSSAAPSGATDQRPDWFDEAEFLTAAKTHFVRLQAAWDVGDMQDIRDYTTTQLFSELTVERQSYDGDTQFTEVVQLDAELLGVTTEDEKLVTAVQFTGTIREAKDADVAPFSEVWRIERDNEQNANWKIAGIEQTGEHRRG